MLAKTQATAIKYATARSSYLPILDCVQIGAAHKKGYRSVYVNNLDYSVAVVASGKFDYAIGDILVDKATALQCLGHKWTCTKDTATFSKNGSERTVAIKDSSEYPSLLWDVSKVKATISLDLETFKADLAYCLKAVSDDMTRPALCGVLLELEGFDDQGALVATDGHRLHRAKIQAEHNDKLSVILDSGFCKFLARLPQKIGTLECEIAENHIRCVLRTDDCIVIIVSRLNEGPFPDYRQVIPKDNTQSFFIDDADVFLKACKEIKPNTSKATNQVTFDFGNGISSLSCINPDAGKASVKLPSTKWGQGWEIDKAGFNVRYLIAAIPKGTEFIELQGKRADSAFTLRFDGQSRYFALVMPLRLGK